MAAHARKLVPTGIKKLLVVGGGAKSDPFLQILADCFQADSAAVLERVDKLCALGAVFRCLAEPPAPKEAKVVRPVRDETVKKAYSELVDVYGEIEKRLLERFRRG